ncbi:hypothetical protein D3C81_1763420 [compost metagenome]
MKQRVIRDLHDLLQQGHWHALTKAKFNPLVLLAYRIPVRARGIIALKSIKQAALQTGIDQLIEGGARVEEGMLTCTHMKNHFGRKDQLLGLHFRTHILGLHVIAL